MTKKILCLILGSGCARPPVVSWLSAIAALADPASENRGINLLVRSFRILKNDSDLGNVRRVELTCLFHFLPDVPSIHV